MAEPTFASVLDILANQLTNTKAAPCCAEFISYSVNLLLAVSYYFLQFTNADLVRLHKIQPVCACISDLKKSNYDNDVIYMIIIHYGWTFKGFKPKPTIVNWKELVKITSCLKY